MLKADHEKDQQEIGALENELASTTDDLEQVNKENTEVLYHILQIGFFYIKHSLWRMSNWQSSSSSTQLHVY